MTDPIEILFMDDVRDMPWGEIVPGLPDPALECYWLDNTLDAQTFINTNGLTFVSRCRLYDLGSSFAVEAPIDALVTHAQIEDLLQPAHG